MVTVQNNNTLPAARWVRWMARGVGTLAAVFWVLILLDIITCDALMGTVCLSWELAALVGITVLSVVSVLLAWWQEAVGGFVLLFWGLGFAVFAYVTSQPQALFAVLISGVPFVLAGILFLLSWQMHQGDQTA